MLALRGLWERATGKTDVVSPYPLELLWHWTRGLGRQWAKAYNLPKLGTQKKATIDLAEITGLKDIFCYIDNHFSFPRYYALYSQSFKPNYNPKFIKAYFIVSPFVIYYWKLCPLLYPEDTAPNPFNRAVALRPFQVCMLLVGSPKTVDPYTNFTWLQVTVSPKACLPAPQRQWAASLAPCLLGCL